MARVDRFSSLAVGSAARPSRSLRGIFASLRPAARLSVSLAEPVNTPLAKGPPLRCGPDLISKMATSNKAANGEKFLTERQGVAGMRKGWRTGCHTPSRHEQAVDAGVVRVGAEGGKGTSDFNAILFAGGVCFEMRRNLLGGRPSERSTVRPGQNGWHPSSLRANC